MSNPGIEAVRKLAHLGYRFTLNGETIKAKYHGSGKPDPETVRPLFETVKAHKPEAVYFLKSYCPRCGGCCFAPDYEGRPLCMACDWGLLVEMYPDLRVKQ
jgi:ribosomal protein S27AE